jgi:hypothetical protein
MAGNGGENQAKAASASGSKYEHRRRKKISEKPAASWRRNHLFSASATLANQQPKSNVAARSASWRSARLADGSCRLSSMSA